MWPGVRRAGRSTAAPGAADLPSAKIDALLDQLREVAGGGHRALVFSQFTGSSAWCARNWRLRACRTATSTATPGGRSGTEVQGRCRSGVLDPPEGGRFRAQPGRSRPLLPARPVVEPGHRSPNRPLSWRNAPVASCAAGPGRVPLRKPAPLIIPSAVDPPARGVGLAPRVKVERPTGRTTLTRRAWSAGLARVDGGRDDQRDPNHLQLWSAIPIIPEPERPRRRQHRCPHYQPWESVPSGFPYGLTCKAGRPRATAMARVRVSCPLSTASAEAH